MKWVLLFVVYFPGDSGPQGSLQRLEFVSEKLCQEAIVEMKEYNKTQAGKESEITAFNPLICIQVWE